MTDVFAAKSAKPMLIGRSGEPFDSPEYVFELKLDGERCLAYLDEAGTLLINRRGRHVLGQFPELSGLHRQKKKRCIIDGELISGIGSKADFEDIKQRGLLRNPHSIQRLSHERPVTFVAIDILYLDRQLTTTLPLHSRQALLASTLRENAVLALSRVVAEKGLEFYERVTAMGLEGIIGKRRDSIYQMGKRTNDWVKIKTWDEVDFIMCGYFRNDG